MIVVQLLATAAALVVAVRAISVVNGMMHRARGKQPWWAWWGFGLSYIAIAMASFGSLIPVLGGELPELYMRLGYAVWAVGSAGLILCDRRRRGTKLGEADRAAIAMIIDGKHRPANDPQQIVQFDTFAEQCGFHGQPLAGVTRCRHPARGALAPCNHADCPVMNAAAGERRSA